MIWRRRPDVVLSTLGHLSVALAALRVLLPDGVRYIAREATVVSELSAVYASPGWWFWLYRRFYARFDTVICQSRHMRDDLVQNFGLPAAKAVVINNPLDIQRIERLAAEPVETFPARRGEIRLVAAGSLTRVKGFDLLIEALALCLSGRFHLTILGDGPLRAELTELARQRGLADVVTFAGFSRNPYAWFRQADAFVLSSRFEGFPNAVLESLACGLPVIAVPCPGGIGEILEDVEGCRLADDCTAVALARALTDFTYGRRIATQALQRYAVGRIVSCYEEQFLKSLVPPPAMVAT